LLCVAFFFVENNVTPAANAKAQELKDLIRGQPPRSYGAGPGGRWTYGHEGRLYNYGLYDPRTKSFQGLSVFQVDRQNQRVLSYRYAAQARWDEDGWRLGEGWQCTLPEGGTPVISRFEGGTKLALDPPANFSERELLLAPGGDVEEGLTVGELRDQIRSLRVKGYDTTRFQVAYHNKLATPATPLVMVLLGLPFAFRIGRRGSLYGIGVALILVIVYWATFAVFRALGLETLLPPALAAWAPSVFFVLLGLYLMLYVRT
jgi:lipopolysaccharide export LptBFGC system permease protein LptF